MEIAWDDSLEHCLIISRSKMYEKKIQGQQSGSEIKVCHFLKIASLVFIDIAQACNLGQCLTSSRAETSKNSCGQNWG